MAAEPDAEHAEAEHAAHARVLAVGRAVDLHQCGRHQRVRRDQAIDETDLVEALGREAEAKRHFHGNRIGQIRHKAMIIAAKQPALCLGHFEDRRFRGDFFTKVKFINLTYSVYTWNLWRSQINRLLFSFMVSWEVN